MTQVIAVVVLILLISAFLLVLGAIIRFSIISPIRTRGAKNRLRSPNLEGIEQLCGFAPPEDLVTLYRTAPFIESTEFDLVDPNRIPPKAWFIGIFNPLSLIDIREQRTITRVPGIPIAVDGERGQYYVSQTGAVLLRSPDKAGGDVEVASTIAAFATFEKREEQRDED